LGRDLGRLTLSFPTDIHVSSEERDENHVILLNSTIMSKFSLLNSLPLELVLNILDRVLDYKTLLKCREVRIVTMPISFK
jgi:hypothetical protein